MSPHQKFRRLHFSLSSYGIKIVLGALWGGGGKECSTIALHQKFRRSHFSLSSYGLIIVLDGFREEEAKCSTITPHQKFCPPHFSLSSYGLNIVLGALWGGGDALWEEEAKASAYIFLSAVHELILLCYTITPHQNYRHPHVSLSNYGLNLILEVLWGGGGQVFHNNPTPNITPPARLILELWPERHSGCALGAGRRSARRYSTIAPHQKSRHPPVSFSDFGPPSFWLTYEEEESKCYSAVSYNHSTLALPPPVAPPTSFALTCTMKVGETLHYHSAITKTKDEQHTKF
ncbi:uncharacterized protein HD556DRAFT_1314586 [Suillus plorans]|uniref:Uncharacterized protein n=1 Tax=Suillus plorans TaxID=116603 RepID=A0A9P7DAV7_9AGAM|nr:uncharacterized protein HD556DRAFT_1314586 [Suillus plorans]KAG1785041.1 hypothetical protein HD556DRAFT_1314586 [Suillus plorans]